MTELHSIDAPRPNRSTGPKTPEGKARCRLNATRHGLTGQLNILTPEEQQAYDHHGKITLEDLAPGTDFERSLAQSIADDLWRLNRARSIESGMFAIGMQNGGDDTGSPEVDDALAQTHTWAQEARNLQLLTIYEQRIQRSVDKNMARLEALRTKREQAAMEDMRQAKLLYQLAQAEGKPYQPEAYFTTVPPVRQSVFSTPEVARELSRDALMSDAKSYWSSGLPRIPRHWGAKASAGASVKSRSEPSPAATKLPPPGPADTYE